MFNVNFIVYIIRLLIFLVVSMDLRIVVVDICIFVYKFKVINFVLVYVDFV